MSTYQHFEVGWTSTYGQYIPPDFDPKKLRESKAAKKIKNAHISVRNMVPFTLTCEKCGQIIGRGTKFNMHGKTMSKAEYGEIAEYLGQRNWAFSFRCPGCKIALTFRTDYAKSYYTPLKNCTLGKELWWTQCMEVKREEDMAADEKKQEIEMRDAKKPQWQMDAMDRLEHAQAKEERSLDLADSVAELTDINKRQARLDPEKVIERLASKRKLVEDQAVKEDFERPKKGVKRIKLIEKPKENVFAGMFTKPTPKTDSSSSSKGPILLNGISLLVKKKKKKKKKKAKQTCSPYTRRFEYRGKRRRQRV